MENNVIETNFVIVGGGISGVSCAETLSFLCPSESIYLITESSLIKAVTNLVPLGKSLTKFDVEERNASTIQNVNILIDSLEYIDSVNNKIKTKSGNFLKYLYLCLCTGGQPKLIDDQNELVIGIRDTDSVIDFQQRIKKSRQICIIGNGGIASEIAYEARQIQIDWVVKDNHIASTFLDPGAAEFLQHRLKNKHNFTEFKPTIKRMRYSEETEKSGAALGPDWHRKIDLSGHIDLKHLPESVKIHYNTEVKSIEKTTNQEYPLKIQLTSNKAVFCDFLISAIGVSPCLNFECDKEFDLHSDGGIKVNEMMQTNIKNIYAAGDVCHASWEWSENWFQMRLWDQARQMGAMAAKAMAASFTNEVVYQDFCFELFGHVTELFGEQVVLLGNYNGQKFGRDYEILLRMTPTKEYIKFVLKDGKLRGAILIGDTGLEETCENLILNKIDLAPYGDDILNPDIDIEDYFD